MLVKVSIALGFFNLLLAGIALFGVDGPLLMRCLMAAGLGCAAAYLMGVTQSRAVWRLGFALTAFMSVVLTLALLAGVFGLLGKVSFVESLRPLLAVIPCVASWWMLRRIRPSTASVDSTATATKS